MCPAASPLSESVRLRSRSLGQTLSDIPGFDVVPLGDTALVIRVGREIDEPTRQRVLDVVRALESVCLPGGADVVPGFTTVTVHYDPTGIDGHDTVGATAYDVVRSRIVTALAAPIKRGATTGRVIEIPGCYGGEFGPDLEVVASHAGLSMGDVVERHAGAEYRVCLLGFLPGFPYLGGLDPQLATPRRDTPRTVVPAGSIGIGGKQTGIYPLESPGGWQLIGRTPAVLFDPLRTPPTLVVPGDRLRFRSIDRNEYDRLRRMPG
ncbi:MAG: 5-oxoprolinase subunit PxpB [Gemmatimonadales bacterium]